LKEPTDIVKLTLYGGAGEIGGNKILLEDKDTKILLDFGMNFSERSKFYSEPWLSPRDEVGLLEFGLLPNIPAAYRFTDAQPDIDAVFLSHSHTDHSAYVTFLNRKIPIYCGETTALILRSFEEVSPKGFDNDLEGLEFRIFRTGDKLTVGSVEVEPVHVDHSVPGCYGFIVHTTDGALVYSGDFRIHGNKPGMTEDFVNVASRTNPIGMLCEGTNMVGADYSTENEVDDKMTKVIDATQNLVLVTFRQTDVDRTRTLLKAAKKNRRRLAISLRQAYLLNRLGADRKLGLPVISSDDFLIFRRKKKQYYKWEQSILDLPNVVDANEVQRIQDKVVLATSFSDLNELHTIRPAPGSSFVLSSSEPFNEEMEIEYDKFVNWLDHFGLPMYHIHCSGHMMPTEIKQVIRKVNPKILIPIHTEHPELYAKFISGTVAVELPEKNRTLQIG
jgi:ribonuclease J